MKHNHVLGWLPTRWLLLFGCLLVFVAAGVNRYVSLLAYPGADTPAAHKMTVKDIITSVRANNLKTFDVTEGKLAAENKQLTLELLDVLQDTGSSNVVQCAAAYFLGERRAAEGVDMLAAKITLHLDHSADQLSFLTTPPAAGALVKLGNRSIPALIRNLADSDDAKIRQASLTVLLSIDRDNDIVQLRLRKALDSQSDPEKQARLQLALRGH